MTPAWRSRSMLDFPVIKLTGKKCFDNRDLLTFSLREIVPVALLKERNRFVALLYHCLQHPLNFRFGNPLGIALSPRGDVPLFQACDDQAHG